MKKFILPILFLLFLNNHVYCQDDSTGLIKVKNFKLSYEYLEKFINDYGLKDSVMNSSKLTECQSAEVLGDSLLLVKHNKGKEIVPFRNITGIKFQSSNSTILGVWIGVASGLAASLLATGTIYAIMSKEKGGTGDQNEIGFALIFYCTAPFLVTGGGILGGIIGSKIHQYKSYDLEIYPPEKRKQEVLRLLMQRSKFKD